MELKRKKAFTFVELIMVIIIIGVLASTGTWLLLYLIQNGIFIPNKLNMDMLASDVMDTIIDGDMKIKGLRCLKRIAAITASRIDFVNQTGETISYFLNTNPPIIYRSINGAVGTPIPYYVPTAGITITGKNNRLFTYYDRNGNITADPAQVRAIDIALITQTGDGSYNNWEGIADLTSRIAVKHY